MKLLNKSNILRDFLKNKNEVSALKLIDHARYHQLNDSEIIDLATGLANSGELIKNENDITYCDIPSTGGPSSLSTLLCPLFLTVFGGKVLKLAVPGRPAGGVDVLAQIRGYKVNLSISELHEWVSQNRYVHFLADDSFAPLDSMLFSLRKANNALNVPAFVIASILSKKIAVGIKNIGLDIRVSNFGNFGNTFKEARTNAIQFNSVARALNIKSRCFLTNGDIPQQPYIGRGESILALNRIFKNEADWSLKRHLAICYRMANSLFNNANIEIQVSSLKEVFDLNIKTQGGDIDHFNSLSNDIEVQNRYIIKSNRSGILSINLLKIRKAITEIQRRATEIQFPDPCGLILKVMPDEYVERGTDICSFRCVSEYKEDFEAMLTDAFDVSNQSTQLHGIEIIE